MGGAIPVLGECMKKLIVVALERLCTFMDNYIIHHLPERLQAKWYCKLAEKSATLDERWKTGVWNGPSTKVSSP